MSGKDVEPAPFERTPLSRNSSTDSKSSIRVRNQEQAAAKESAVEPGSAGNVTTCGQQNAEVRPWRGEGCSVDVAELEKQIAMLEDALRRVRARGLPPE